MPQLEDLISLALAAGREIMAVRAAGIDAQVKADGSLVTIADQRAEAIIEAGLAELDAGVPMLGEEAVAAGRIPDCGARFYCVDPLDGTRGFANGGDEFTVNIALVENATPVVGVVYAPATGELYAGQPSKALAGKCHPQTGKLLAPMAAIAPGAFAQQPRVVASDYSGRNERTGDFIAALNGVITHASSSIKFCRVAEGAADLYPRFGDVSEWDAAAGHAILKAAGGDIMLLDGSPLRYGGRNGDFLIHGFVAYGNATAKAAALQALTR
ncbi:3'(2'),5'-bisphosphate nucleotidase CysQ family protein [Candidatus Viadribacter manganicus]|nr:inositol monophosphatase family protein [Candidatus Viadribacter manganicus]